MQAACSISGEIETNVPLRSQIANAWLNAALISIRPNIVSLSLIVFISCEIPTRRTTGANIWLITTNPRKPFFPLNDILARAYAAGILHIIAMKVAPKDRSMEFNRYCGTPLVIIAERLDQIHFSGKSLVKCMSFVSDMLLNPVTNIT